MSRARNLADLLDSNGDVVSGALDNVPASNDASALTTGTLPIARIADGDVTAAKLASTLDLSGKTVTMSAANLTGTLPAIDGSNLTGISSYSDSDALDLFNAAGSAPVYACRAWVNFNGSGTVFIRASGNVSSITDYGTGDYRVNFSTSMPDANYTTTYAGGRKTITWGIYLGYSSYGSSTTGHRFYNVTPSDTVTDTDYSSLAFFR